MSRLEVEDNNSMIINILEHIDKMKTLRIMEIIKGLKELMTGLVSMSWMKIRIKINIETCMS